MVKTTIVFSFLRISLFYDIKLYCFADKDIFGRDPDPTTLLFSPYVHKNPEFLVNLVKNSYVGNKFLRGYCKFLPCEYC